MREAAAVSEQMKLRAARATAESLQEEAGTTLYGRLISPGGPANVAAVADILGVGHSTVYRQCSGEIPVQLRTLAALALLDFEGCKALLDLMGRKLGVEWKWHPEYPQPPSQADVLQSVTEVSLACSEAAVLEVMALRDGQVTQEELRDLEKQWTEEDYKRERMRAQIRSLAGPVARSDGPEPEPMGF